MRLFTIISILLLQSPAFSLEEMEKESAYLIPGRINFTACKKIEESAFISANTSARPISLSEESVDATFNKNAGPLTSIYKKAQKSDPCVAGAIIVSLSIDEGGTVADVSFRASNKGIQKIGPDLIEVIKGFKFEKPAKSEFFEYPLTFVPGHP